MSFPGDAKGDIRTSVLIGGAALRAARGRFSWTFEQNREGSPPLQYIHAAATAAAKRTGRGRSRMTLSTRNARSANSSELNLGQRPS
jgi:hypothetical protein